MGAPWLSSTCRVCLASGRKVYGLANTPLEKTYEQVTNGTLVVEGRPCSICSICLSTLHRCRRFIDAAREANDVLNQWSQDQSHLTERPLFTFINSPVTYIEIASQRQELDVKQEIVTTENNIEAEIPVKKIKLEITNDDDFETTQMSDTDECQNTQVSHSESINLYDKMVDIKIELDQDNNVKDHSKKSEYVSHGVSDGGNNEASSDEDKPLTRLRSSTTVMMNEDTERDPLLKIRIPVTPEHQGNTDPAAHIHNGNTFSCTHCQNINRRHLKKQLKVSRSTKDKPIPRKCDKCDYKSSYRSNFLRHIRIHSDEKPYACNKCEFRCIRKQNLDMHYLRHTDEKHLACSFCDYKCNRADSLREHLFKHTGEKPFSCDKCDFKCSRKTNLDMHLITHNEKKQFACGFCNYETNRSDSFRQHVLRHTGEQPYLCDKCHYKCSRSSNLKRHLLTHKEHSAV